MNKILCVDPGDKRLGLAVSDDSGTIANPLQVILHIKREIDAATIAQIAGDLNVKKIIVGQAIDDEGQVSFQGRKAARLAEAIQTQCSMPVILWDESGSTQEARHSRVAMNVTKRNRAGHLDEIAATYILQTYLDSEHDKL
jgi:putative holliday junction resolvase